MHLYLHIFIFFFLFPQLFTKVIEVYCPSHCKCDIFEKFRRATCVNKSLAVIESNLPKETQILDLSFNQISHLDDHIFIDQNLLSLKLLNISNNKLSHIQLNAFEGLKKLKTLDLSYNALQYLFQNLFWSLESLEELYLRGNSFPKIEELFFESTTLKRLDLSDCKIAYLGKDALSKIPNLEVLDISQNYLIHLNAATILPLQNLTILNAWNNTFSCDEVLKNLTKYCVHKGIRFKDPCQKDVNSEKFQRIISSVEPEDEKNSWIYDDEENVKNITKIIEKCSFPSTKNKTLLEEIVDLSPTLSIIIPFIYGVSIGILITCTVQIFSKKKKETEEFTYVSFDEENVDSYKKKRRSRRFSRNIPKEDRESLPLREWKLSESTPVLYRKNQVMI